MRIRHWQQLFLLNASLIVAALAGVLLVQQESFRSGLLDYLNGMDRQRMVGVAGALADHYRRSGDWESMRGRPAVWLRVVGAGMGRQGPPPDDEPPPPRDSRRLSDRPRPAFAPPHGEPPPRAGPPPPRAEPPPRRGGGMDLPARLVLLDEEGRHVGGGGDIHNADFGLPIEVDGRTVGQLRLTPLPRIEGDDDLAFVRQQAWLAAVAGGVALLLALLASVALGARLLRPLRHITAGARALATGDYAVRVAPARGEIGALAVDFNRLAIALQQASQSRRQWIADISHELRTPLAILRGELHALEDGVRSFTPEAVVSLRVEAERLTGLVDDLYQLSLADLGALAYRFETLDLGVSLDQAVALHRPRIAAAGLNLEWVPPDQPMPTLADPQRLAQLWSNLLTNAARYSDPGGRVCLSVRAQDERWLVQIDDTPPGVSAADLPRLFERLFRAEQSRNRDSGGAGLGLAIAKSIVVAHAGDIDAEASPLGGLRINLHLPRKRNKS